MSSQLSHLKPTELWNNFESLCGIPRPSKHEEKVTAFVQEFAKAHKIECEVDNIGNVILRKDATAGMEKAPSVVMQSHLDMVPQKDSDIEHDFEKDSIRPRIDGNLVKATGTTLGADNGIGVAAILTAMASPDIAHGPLEALLTVDEEAGMTGARHLESGKIKSKILFNLDSEDEGEFCIGCAGGKDTVAKLPYTSTSTPSNAKLFSVEVTGLKGGHSGIDVGPDLANGIKVLTRLLWVARKEMELHLVSIDGGTLRNTIPREAKGVVAIRSEDVDSFKKAIEKTGSAIKAEYKKKDGGLTISVDESKSTSNVFDTESTDRILNTIYACPDGVFAMLRDMPSIQETSTNLGIVTTEKDGVSVVTLQRSAVESKREDVANMVRSVMEMGQGKVEHENPYPGWTPNVKSPALKTLCQVYESKFGKNPAVMATHGGLECGLIMSAYPGLDAISFGPTIRYPHTPREEVDIQSVERFWDFLLEALKEMKKD